MIKRLFQTAATIAALAVLVGLTTPVASQAAGPVRNQNVGVETERAASPAGLLQTLADFWQGLVGSMFAGSEGGSGEDQAGEGNSSGAPPENGGGGEESNNGGGTTDEGPGADPDG